MAGLPLSSYFSAPKVRWLRETGHDTGVVTTTDAYLLYHLCGAYVTDLTTASRTLLLDLAAGAWSDELAALFRVEVDQLPVIVPCDATIGQTDLFGASALVRGLAADQQAALWAHARRANEPAKVTYGTGAFALATIPDPAQTGPLPTSVAWSVDGRTRYCGDGQVFSAGPH